MAVGVGCPQAGIVHNSGRYNVTKWPVKILYLLINLDFNPLSQHQPIPLKSLKSLTCKGLRPYRCGRVDGNAALRTEGGPVAVTAREAA